MLKFLLKIEVRLVTGALDVVTGGNTNVHGDEKIALGVLSLCMLCSRLKTCFPCSFAG
jgi:hypothetical protein